MNVQAIADGVCVSPQIEPAAIAELARAGFMSVVNNRPDHEGGVDQPTSAAIEAAALAAGLVYVHLPVQPANHSPDEIARAAELLATLPRPVLMFCRSGARSNRLYQEAQAHSAP